MCLSRFKKCKKKFHKGKAPRTGYIFFKQNPFGTKCDLDVFLIDFIRFTMYLNQSVMHSCSDHIQIITEDSFETLV